MSLVSRENIEIFVVIHEKAIQRSLKNEKETKSPEKVYILTAEERKQIRVAPQGLNKKSPRSASRKACWEVAPC